MSRTKKNKTLKGKINLKTGSKKDLIEDFQRGNIPSHNKLAKHKKTKQKSAYQRFLDQQKTS